MARRKDDCSKLKTDPLNRRWCELVEGGMEIDVGRFTWYRLVDTQSVFPEKNVLRFTAHRAGMVAPDDYELTVRPVEIHILHKPGGKRAMWTYEVDEFEPHPALRR